MRRGGIVYFAQDELTGLIKIGTTNYLYRRIKQLAAEWNHPITLLGFVYGRFGKEAALHARFADYRHRSEWFYPHPDILGFITKSANVGWPKRISWTSDEKEFAAMLNTLTRSLDTYANAD
jgi:hypothetical protein